MVICKIFGHKDDGKDTILRHTGWSRDWNTVYNHHEFGYSCKRCQKMVVVGIIHTNKQGELT